MNRDVVKIIDATIRCGARDVSKGFWETYIYMDGVFNSVYISYTDGRRTLKVRYGNGAMEAEARWKEGAWESSGDEHFYALAVHAQSLRVRTEDVLTRLLNARPASVPSFERVGSLRVLYGDGDLWVLTESGRKIAHADRRSDGTWRLHFYPGADAQLMYRELADDRILVVLECLSKEFPVAVVRIKSMLGGA